jgi:hypothetical protein
MPIGKNAILSRDPSSLESRALTTGQTYGQTIPLPPLVSLAQARARLDSPSWEA